MMMRPSADYRARGFTLIELLVVIGIMAVLAGALGLGLRGGNQTVALQGAQSLLAAMVSATRGRAAVAGENARLLVNAENESPDRYLRYLVVAVDDGNGTFQAVGEGMSLPSGVRVVPPSNVPVTSGVVWGDAAKSNALSGSMEVAEMQGTTERWYYVELTKFGAAMVGARLVIAPADQTPGGLVFSDPDNVRGLIISRYGTVTLINDAAGID